VYYLAGAVRALAPEAYDSHLFALEVRTRPCGCQLELFGLERRVNTKSHLYSYRYRPGCASWIARPQAIPIHRLMLYNHRTEAQ
jgi:hypothetical protein